MTIGARIKEARTSAGISVAELASAAGLKPTTIYDLERGDSDSTTKLHLIADFLKVHAKWLETGKGPKSLSILPGIGDPDTMTEAQLVAVGRMLGLHDHDGQINVTELKETLISMRAGQNAAQGLMIGRRTDSDERFTIGGTTPDEQLIHVKESNVSFRGGPGHDLDCDIIEDSEPATYQLSWFHKERLNPERVVRFRTEGDSNEPFLFNGDRILVNLDETEIKNGKVYAFWQEGEGRRVKRLFKDRKGNVTLRSYNPDYPDEILDPEEVAEKIKIIGRVRDKSGRGGL